MGKTKTTTPAPKRIKGESVAAAAPANPQLPVGGRLSQFHQVWPQSDKWVRSMIRNGLKLPFTKNMPSLKRTTIDSRESTALMNAVQEFLEKGALEETKTVGLTARLFIVEQGEKLRPILDCRPLNQFLTPQHFKMEDLKVLATIIQPKDYMVKVDLKDAYLHVPIWKQHRKYLQICVGGKRYQFKALPFGLNIAPQTFTRVLKAALLPLRKKGIKMVAYLDDICIMAESGKKAQEQGMEVVMHLENLGFIINKKKTCLEPMQCREFLGMMVDTKEMTLSVPSKKLRKIKREALQILQSKTWPLRKFAATVGLMSSVCRATKNGRIMTRALYADMRKTLYPDNQWNDKPVKISPESREELEWWTKNLGQFNGRPLIEPPFSKQIWTDASGKGWGAVCGKEVAHGRWNRQEKELTSNQKESLAILKGLEAFTSQLRGQVVQIHSDNMTAVSNVGRQGGTHSAVILTITKKIWAHALKNQMWLKIQHIRGLDNGLADQASRMELQRDEYYLSDQAMQKISSQLGTPTIDLFASKENRRCRNYMSRAEDAFSISWKDLGLPLIHPPIKLIPKILRKLTDDQVAEAILVMPNWQNLPYFPLIEAMRTSKDVCLKKGDLIMTSESRLWRVNVSSMIALTISGLTSQNDTRQAKAWNCL